MASEQLDELARAAELHDIGKVAIPDAILNKPGPLDDDEWSFMRRHTIIGERILGAAPALRPVARLVRASHESWDGNGYPDGLAGEEIPLGARIVAVCDAYHAMISDRPYREAMLPAEAVAELRALCGHPVRSHGREGLRDAARAGGRARCAAGPGRGAYARVKRRPVVGESSSSSLTRLRPFDRHRQRVALLHRLLGGSGGLEGGEALRRELAGVLLLDPLQPLRALGRLALVDLDAADLERRSISANSSSTRSSWGTFRSGLPWAKIRPSFLAPVMPKSACDASPMPLTAQPSTATSIGSS